MYKKIGTFFVLFALALFVTGSLALLNSSKAHAAAYKSLASCSGTNCDNLDPKDTGCALSVSSPSSATVRQSDGSHVEEHWGNCQTNWTWAVLYNDNPFSSDYETLTVRRFGGNGLSDKTNTVGGLDCRNDCYGNQLYTNNNTAQSCIEGPNMDQSRICAPAV